VTRAVRRGRFKEWPFNWADYPDMAKYTGGQQ